MKRYVLGFAMILIAGFAVWAWSGSGTPAPAAQTTSTAQPTALAESTARSPSLRAPLPGHPAPPDTARAATTLRLADGDSFDIEWTDTGERDEVRLLGVNAPEARACFGEAARDTLEVLITGETLLIEGVERDEFGRVIANVWVGELFVNATLVELGAALALSGDGAHAELITAAQELARGTQRGLWDSAQCGVDPETALLKIVAIHADAAGRDDQNPNGEWIEIANAGATVVDLTGWSVRDESTRHRFFFPDGFLLPPGDLVRVYSGCGEDDAGELYWCDGDPIWNNGGDTGFIVDPDGRFADTLSYPT